jgi:hypothetical protein
MLTWVICGAGRGVGKTHLAQELCRVLPDSVYAKQGHGTPKPGKSPNLFHTEEELAHFVGGCAGRYAHVVVESNAWARQGRGDIIIFIEGVPEHTNYRPDVDLLRSRSHLRIGPNAPTHEWQPMLQGKLSDRSLCDAVREVLIRHRDNLAGHPSPYRGEGQG